MKGFALRGHELISTIGIVQDKIILELFTNNGCGFVCVCVCVYATFVPRVCKYLVEHRVVVVQLGSFFVAVYWRWTSG